MNPFIGLAALIVHLLALLALAPLTVGLIDWARARLAGRAAPTPMQPWRDLLRLAAKQPVLAENASPLFRHAPAAVFAVTLAAAALVPGFALGMTTAPLADFIVLVGLLALARVVLALAALDTGTALGGLGASRTLDLAVFAAPASLLAILALALLAGGTNLDAIVAALRAGVPGPRLPLGFALAALAVVALADSGRAPFADPAAHAEPAMGQEAMGLDYSARHLALLKGAAALRLLVWLSLLGALACPFGIAAPGDGALVWLLALPAWVARLGVLAVALAGLESAIAGLRLARAPELLAFAAALGLLALMFLLVGRGGV
jgi:formate hydrogenlyase subunit 4